MWLSELFSNLIEYSNGVFFTPNVANVYFILQSEVETIWKNDFNVKKVHFILLFPNFEKLEESIEYLSKFGNLTKEGRPKIYISAEKMIFGLKSIDKLILKCRDILKVLSLERRGGRNLFILTEAIIYLADRLLAKEYSQKAALTQCIISEATGIAEYSIRDHYVNLLKPLFLI